MNQEFRDLPSWMLARAALRSHRIVAEHLRRQATTGYQFRVLSTLRHEPATQADIGRHAQLDRRDVAVTVGELAGNHLVLRGHSSTDARVRVVSITDLGQERLARLDTVIQGAQEEIFGVLKPPERRQLLDVLHRIAEPHN